MKQLLMMRRRSLRLSTLVISIGLLLTGCGGGSDDVDPNLQVGKISATPVENLRYRTASQEGRTGRDGSFRYRPGETVQFSVGHIEFEATAAKDEVTLLDIAGTNDTGNAHVVNMSRFLQSLDDPSDGVITIDHNADLLGCTVDVSNIDFEQPTQLFAANGTVSDFIQSAGQTGRTVSAGLAQDNLESALAGRPLTSTLNEEAEGDADPLGSRGKSIDQKRNDLFGEYFFIGLTGDMSDAEPGRAAGRSYLGLSGGLAAELVLSLNLSSGTTQAEVNYQDANIMLYMDDGVAFDRYSQTEQDGDPPEATNEFVTDEGRLGILTPRRVDFEEMYYFSDSQTVHLGFDELPVSQLYPYNDSLYFAAEYYFQNYEVSATDDACVAALSLSPQDFASEERIRAAFEARTVNDAARIATLEVMRRHCEEQMTFEDAITDFVIGLRKHDNFSIEAMAGEYAAVFLDYEFGAGVGNEQLDIDVGLERFSVDETGSVDNSNGYQVFNATSINGGGSQAYLETVPVADEAYSYSLPIDASTGQLLRTGQLNYNILASGSDVVESTIPAYISGNGNLLLSNHFSEEEYSAFLSVGVRLHPTNQTTLADLENKTFHFWGHRAMQQFTGGRLDGLIYSNLEGFRMSFVTKGDDLVAELYYEETLHALSPLTVLSKTVSSLYGINSTPVQISEDGEISFEVNDGGGVTRYRGYLSTDGQLLLAIQGINGASLPIDPSQPNRVSYGDITSATTGIALGLSVSKQIDREILGNSN